MPLSTPRYIRVTARRVGPAGVRVCGSKKRLKTFAQGLCLMWELVCKGGNIFFLKDEGLCFFPKSRCLLENCIFIVQFPFRFPLLRICQHRGKRRNKKTIVFLRRHKSGEKQSVTRSANIPAEYRGHVLWLQT